MSHSDTELLDWILKHRGMLHSSGPELYRYRLTYLRRLNNGRRSRSGRISTDGFPTAREAIAEAIRADALTGEQPTPPEATK